jgi:predicted PurR-regulated permease PerM
MALVDIDRSRALWWTFGTALALALAYVVYAFVGTVVFGVFLYYATRPVYRRIRRQVRQPTLAAAISLLALAAPALLLVAYALIVVVTEAERLVGEVDFVDLTQVPGLDEETLALISDPEALATLDWTQYVSSNAISSVLGSVSNAADTVAFFGTGLVHLFVMFAIAFYLLRDGDRLRRWLGQFADDQGVVMAYARGVDHDYRNIFFGNILNAVLTGTIGVIAYSLLNLIAPPRAAIPAAALVGLLAGVASLIPVVGMKLVYFPVAAGMGLRAVVTGSTPTLWFVLVFGVVSFLIVDTIPDLVLRPYVSGRSLHVGAVMLAYTLGPLLFGWYGIFLMPMLLVLVIRFVKIVLPELAAGKRLQPYSVDPAYIEELGSAIDEESTATATDATSDETAGTPEKAVETKLAESGSSDSTGEESSSREASGSSETVPHSDGGRRERAGSPEETGDGS